MLYVTTREKADAFTANHALREERGKCGGFFLPYRLPVFGETEIQVMQDIPFGERVARILNLFFSANLNGWDVEFAVGRRPVRVAAMSHKIAVIETWHNHDGNLDALVEALYGVVAKDESDGSSCGAWFYTAVRIAVLFGVFGDLIKTGIADFSQPVDIALAVDDFSAPMAVWYARKMGLPIGRIICCCNDNSVLWDFLHHGTLSTTVKIVSTVTPDSDYAIPPMLECLIFEVLGYEESQRFVKMCRDGNAYSLGEDKLSALRNGLFCAVVRQQRIESIIRNVYKTNAYLMDPYTALGFGGLQDYRAARAETGTALILSDRRPQ